MTGMAELDAVAVLGTGAIGGAIARRLLQVGHRVAVWNRTRSRSAELAQAGARVADSVREAVSSSALVLLPLSSYEAVRQVLAAAGEALEGRTIAVLCTGTPEDARATAALITAAGGDYLDGGVQASPETVGTPAATFLFGGSRAVFVRHAPTLGQLGTARFAGETPEAAAVWDLALFGAWYDAQLGLLRAFESVRAAGIDVAEFAGTVAPSLGYVLSGVPGTVDELTKGVYPAGPAPLREHLKVLRQLIALRAGQRLGDGGLTVAVEAVEALIAGGRGDEGLTATIG